MLNLINVNFMLVNLVKQSVEKFKLLKINHQHKIKLTSSSFNFQALTPHPSCYTLLQLYPRTQLITTALGPSCFDVSRASQQFSSVSYLELIIFPLLLPLTPPQLSQHKNPLFSTRHSSALRELYPLFRLLLPPFGHKLLFY